SYIRRSRPAGTWCAWSRWKRIPRWAGSRENRRVYESPCIPHCAGGFRRVRLRSRWLECRTSREVGDRPERLASAHHCKSRHRAGRGGCAVIPCMEFRCEDLPQYGVVLVGPTVAEYNSLLADIRGRMEHPVAGSPPVLPKAPRLSEDD